MKTLIVSIVFSICIFSVNAQSFLVNGYVYDDQNLAVTGATITLLDKSSGTITDLKGFFQIKCPLANDSIIVSFIGYKTKVVPVESKSNLKIKLEPDNMTLEEVVVIRGYSSQRGSILSGIKSKTKNEAIQGRIAGVTIRGRAPIKSNCMMVATSSTTTVTDESYAQVSENGFQSTKNKPLSTFSIDVDKASYSNVRRYLNNGQLPPADAVRIEEMINYFDYSYNQPQGDHPFEINTEAAACPWAEKHKLVLIGVQGRKIDTRELPASNLVFLIDVSGSMQSANKLPLLKQAFTLLADNLRENDRVAIVVYAGAAGCVLPSTNGSNKIKIKEALAGLEAGGSTAGGEGLRLAYEIARKNFIKEGNNRVILATDGDFNVGASSDADMETLITNERKSGVFLTCLGFGMGNLKDSKLETLADKGNGNYAYIDNIQEAQRTLVSEFGGTLFTIAKDVKIQVEFNPLYVKAYRLVGYENRLLNDEDFKDDTKDAGELGAGHTVTALYEIIPVGVKSEFDKDIDPLKYQTQNKTSEATYTDEIATVKMRYKLPDGGKSIPLEKIIPNSAISMDEASENLKFSSAVAMFGMVLRKSEFKGNSSLSMVIKLASEAKSNDTEGYKAEFVRLVRSSLSLASNN